MKLQPLEQRIVDLMREYQPVDAPTLYRLLANQGIVTSKDTVRIRLNGLVRLGVVERVHEGGGGPHVNHRTTWRVVG